MQVCPGLQSPPAALASRRRPVDDWARHWAGCCITVREQISFGALYINCLAAGAGSLDSYRLPEWGATTTLLSSPSSSCLPACLCLSSSSSLSQFFGQGGCSCSCCTERPQQQQQQAAEADVGHGCCNWNKFVSGGGQY